MRLHEQFLYRKSVSKKEKGWYLTIARLYSDDFGTHIAEDFSDDTL